MSKYNDYRWTTDWKNPKYGDFLLEPMFGDVSYWNGKEWRDNWIQEDNGDVFEIVRLDIVPSPDDFELVMQ